MCLSQERLLLNPLHHLNRIYDSNPTGLSGGLRIHILTTNHVYKNIALMYIVYVSKINDILIHLRYLQQDLAAVDTHRKHRSPRHGSDPHRRPRVGSVVVTGGQIPYFVSTNKPCTATALIRRWSELCAYAVLYSYNINASLA